ncbi:MAG: hypothetical protein IJ240_08780 [Clostridia bacterium]|nr:hypothetical protein [Clostridia bacterium]
MSKHLTEKIKEIKTPEDMMQFFDENIQYSCIHVDGKKYIDSLGGHDFREKFRTMSLEKSLEEQLGGCFEQANISKYVYDMLGIPCHTFCTRGHSEEHPAPDDLYLVHCYVIGQWEDRFINIEHSDAEKRGIYAYYTLDDAVRAMDEIFSEKFKVHGATETRVDEYVGYIPGGATFLEFNQFVKENLVVK